MKRDALLDAAEALLCEQGTQALTLSAVAERAQVSKGGLLYHFPNKEALIRGLVERLIEEFDALIAAYETSGPGSYTRAFVEANLAVVMDRDHSRLLRRWATVSAAAADPTLLTQLREAMHRWHDRDPADDPDPVAAQVARLAAEGLWEVVMHDPDLYDEAQLETLRQRLLALL
ncbi:TetR/AcrR family transcriptional regulator [Actinoallomurus sp. CA-150999]|uniref:TetR/AcrR family transcriptional regulator n=1 Tax=Actinoallomurus sp. CA-150999 TaxID=3239887 RepID=UPI003D915863